MEKKNKSKKKNLIITIIALISLVVTTIGISYAFFRYTKEGTRDNVITTGSITFLYTEVDKVGKGISISDAFPMTDEQGKLQTEIDKVFNFKITSTTSNGNSIPYEITVRKSKDSTLNDEAVKLYLTKVNEDDEEEQVVLSKYSDLNQTEKIDKDKYTEKTIYLDKVPANSTRYEQNYRLRMWIDNDTDFSNEDMNNKKFQVTVNVYANAKIVTEEDQELESNVEIKSIQIDNHYAVKVENEEYDYEIGIDDENNGSLKVVTVNPYASTEVKELEGINLTSLVTPIPIENEDNYYSIQVTSEDGQKSKEYKIHIHKGKYQEKILNGTDPVVKDSLIPIMIEEDGTVRKVNNSYKWYSYDEKNWANAIILKDEQEEYEVGEIIPEDKIESYFVWIPKYRYQIWDLGTSYTSLPGFQNRAQEIHIQFETGNTINDTEKKECVAPNKTGDSGNCQKGYYMTHPAFTAFGVNGIWVGKFETGYDGATTTTEAEQNSNDSNSIIIKPNVYSWRNITVGNAFEASYNYKRTDLDSHMMKNTEWGAVAYLSHSKYGTCTDSVCNEIRINNNGAYITGYAGINTPTVGYNNEKDREGNHIENTTEQDGKHTIGYFSQNQRTNQLASTTGNKTGIYDMSGGTWEYVMGYTTLGGNKNQSGFSSIEYDLKYYDSYSSSKDTDYNKRILGDATGEMGPFGSETDPDSNIRYKSSWYKDSPFFVQSSSPWFQRGGGWFGGTGAGVFAFGFYTGGVHADSFRIVLAPKNN